MLDSRINSKTELKMDRWVVRNEEFLEEREMLGMCGVKLYFFFSGRLPSACLAGGGGRAAVEEGTRQKTQPLLYSKRGTLFLPFSSFLFILFVHSKINCHINRQSWSCHPFVVRRPSSAPPSLFVERTSIHRLASKHSSRSSIQSLAVVVFIPMNERSAIAGLCGSVRCIEVGRIVAQ